MDRLTIPDEPIEGGMRRGIIDVRAVREEAMTIYWRLKKYEDICPDPEILKSIDELYLEKCREVTELKAKNKIFRAHGHGMRCNNCNSELQKARIYDSDRYQVSHVYDDNNKAVGGIYYCPKCGNLQIPICET